MNHKFKRLFQRYPAEIEFEDDLFLGLYLMGYFIWLILSRKSIFGHTIKFLEPGRSSTDQSAFIASEFELRQKIENRCRRLIKIRDIPPPI